MTSSAAPRIVLDTNVWLDLLWFGDPACARLGAAISAGRWQPVTRHDCREEWCRVLDYPVFALDRATQARLLDAYDRCCQMIGPACPVPHAALPRCRDPDDQKFLELARDAGAVVVLSRDQALLRLSAPLQRRGLFPVLRPAQFDLA